MKGPGFSAIAEEPSRTGRAKYKNMTRTVLAAIMMGALLAAGMAQAGATADARCKEKKAKAAGKRAADLMKAFGKNMKKRDTVELAQDVSKADSKFAKSFEKADKKGGCETSGDAGAIETKVDVLVFEMVATMAPSCGDNIEAGPDEECDRTDDAACPGICQANCRCPVPKCGNGVLEVGEQCEPPCSEGPPCGSGEICGVSCDCVPNEPCSCGTPEPTHVDFMMEIDTANFCGQVKDSGDVTVLDLVCANSYLGGGNLGGFTGEATPVPIGTNIQKVDCCYGTTLALTNTTSAETGSTKTCTEGTTCSSDSAPCRLDSDCGSGTCEDRCTLGAPIPTIADPPVLSVCTVDVIEIDSHGYMDCSSGEGAMDLPIRSDVALTSDSLPRRCDAAAGVNMGRRCTSDSQCVPGTCLWDWPSHCDSNSGPNAGAYCTSNAQCAPGTCVDDSRWQPCPICNPTTLKCNGGLNDGHDCTPGTPELSPAFPTSQDCPPPASLVISTAHMPYPLTTGRATLDATDGNFCGWCRDILGDGSGCFDGDPATYPAPGQRLCPDSAVIPDCQPASYHGGLGGSISRCGPLSMIPCSSDADCYEPYETCEQKDSGAFDRGEAAHIVTWGSPAGNVSDRGVHDVTVSGVFCAPATFAVADDHANLPGPGAVSLTGQLRLRPSPSGAFLDATHHAVE